MNKEDMILISVDDHIVEPPDMFKNHLSEEVPRRRAAAGAQPRRLGHLAVPRRGDPQRRAERGGRAAEGGVRPGAAGSRRDPAGLLQRRRARQGHERRRHPRLDVLPVVPRLRRPAVRHRGSGVLAGAGAGLQRLARRGVVRGVPGPVHPDDAAGDLGRRGVCGRDPAQRQARRALADVHREPGGDGLSELPRLRLLEADVGGAGATPTPCSTCTSGRRAGWRSPRRMRRWT